MKALILVLCISLVGCGTKYRVIHKPLVIPSQCEFELFTGTEKDSMIEAVGRKIYRNQENCRLRQDRIDSLIKNHNLAHEDK